jgi:hypothetical protein
MLDLNKVIVTGAAFLRELFKACNVTVAVLSPEGITTWPESLLSV